MGPGRLYSGSSVGASSPQSCASNLRGPDGREGILPSPAPRLPVSAKPCRIKRAVYGKNHSSHSKFPPSSAHSPLLAPSLSSHLPAFPPSPHFTFSANYGSHCALALNMDQKRERRKEELNSDPSGYKAALKTPPWFRKHPLSLYGRPPGSELMREEKWGNLLTHSGWLCRGPNADFVLPDRQTATEILVSPISATPKRAEESLVGKRAPSASDVTCT